MKSYILYIYIYLCLLLDNLERTYIMPFCREQISVHAFMCFLFYLSRRNRNDRSTSQDQGSHIFCNAVLFIYMISLQDASCGLRLQIWGNRAGCTCALVGGTEQSCRLEKDGQKQEIVLILCGQMYQFVRLVLLVSLEVLHHPNTDNKYFVQFNCPTSVFCRKIFDFFGKYFLYEY